MSGQTDEFPEPQGPASEITTEPYGLVFVSVFGSDQVNLPYTPGHAVSDYLAEATVRLGEGQSVSMNAKETTLDAAVEPNSTITVAGRVTNG